MVEVKWHSDLLSETQVSDLRDAQTTEPSRHACAGLGMGALAKVSFLLQDLDKLEVRSSTRMQVLPRGG